MEEIETEAETVYTVYSDVTDNGMDSHTMYITSHIDSPSKFTHIVNLLLNCETGDIVTLILCTEGGDLYSALLLMDALEKTKAVTTARIIGEVASAGTLVALACDSVEATPFSNFMIHNYSTTIQGKGGEIKSRLEFEHKNISEIFYKCYSNFLSEIEISKVLYGVDMYLDVDSITSRFAKVIEARTASTLERVGELEEASRKSRLEVLEEELVAIQNEILEIVS